jgi:hypothetical protein
MKRSRAVSVLGAGGCSASCSGAVGLQALSVQGQGVTRGRGTGRVGLLRSVLGAWSSGLAGLPAVGPGGCAGLLHGRGHGLDGYWACGVARCRARSGLAAGGFRHWARGERSEGREERERAGWERERNGRETLVAVAALLEAWTVYSCERERENVRRRLSVVGPTCQRNGEGNEWPAS